ncbi:MAG: RNA 2',3'-cyclic phosphodiesterase [Desulfarculus sp.]|nr:RNA 2',3'-cyclic phosphodiesterase [Pseudomonadota bacterium]MBV1717788.1 RNA 2',3'-cyclic phosphodiesterase [Desulfarculus sp.]MBU4575993.1 RNA 2',3'-cyclic phosphodiesterase [Pseudomonadota bacterium]MBU4596786.1 RNA 2',3'-cyclic phosphodiesterase [Pseudomonadota bacterium]MBV1740446.1 RNA 2',3'-cyclic phosphodiesterase [Desulfarculus sp.]
MRSFIALEMPPEVKEFAAGLIKELKPSGADVKWVEPMNLHLTLKFLGEVDPSATADIITALEGALAGRSAPGLSAAGCGAFPNARSPKVVWLGLGGQTDLVAQMARAVETALEPLGFEAEKRAFKPHLTLGRVRRPRRGAGAPSTAPLSRALAALAAAAGPSFRADRVVLMKSTLTGSGPIYESLHHVTLV